MASPWLTETSFDSDDDFNSSFDDPDTVAEFVDLEEPVYTTAARQRYSGSEFTTPTPIYSVMRPTSASKGL